MSLQYYQPRLSKRKLVSVDTSLRSLLPFLVFNTAVLDRKLGLDAILPLSSPRWYCAFTCTSFRAANGDIPCTTGLIMDGEYSFLKESASHEAATARSDFFGVPNPP
jgi:hypothetical protein